MSEVFFAASARTPIGKFGGTLKDWTAADLAVPVVQESLRRAGLEPSAVEEVIIGCARQAGGGPNVARQIGYRAGVPETVPAYTVNKACGSGLKAVILAAQEILLNRARCVVAGGTESMSRVPYLAEGTRWGLRMGNAALVDGMYRDGFLDPLSGQVMGETAETLARQYDISRREQDEYALRSQLRAEAATGRLRDEIVPLSIAGRKGNAAAFATDEHARAGVTIEAMEKLPPVFAKDGTVTAGNSSGITDGAAALLVLSEEMVKTAGITPQARLVDYEIAGVDPRVMGIGPVPAIRKLLARRKLTLADIGLVELNEAFAAQVLACDRELHFDPERLNVNGGAIALGHPIGCTGARILTTLMHEMQRRQEQYGLATLCISGGMGIALLVERV
ncbi:MAG TPA: acetyl-CoA C-acetyltransferase [Blastocatellia bacterium]|nr:acetyl-CoA C-acetyltransferase [Blastocatellia bacterium]